MTIMIGARCKDGVVLVSDRRLVRAGGLELQSPECKLRAVRGVLIGAVGMSAFYDTVERLLMSKFPDSTVLATAWDIAELADEVVKQYEGLKDDRPFFPVLDRVNGKARLWQVTAGLPPGEMDYEVWGRSEAYGAIGRLFPWQETPMETGWRVMLFFVAIAAKVSFSVGDGVDVGLGGDDTDSIEIKHYLQPRDSSVFNTYEKAKRLVETLPQFITDGICRSD